MCQNPIYLSCWLRRQIIECSESSQFWSFSSMKRTRPDLLADCVGKVPDASRRIRIKAFLTCTESDSPLAKIFHQRIPTIISCFQPLVIDATKQFRFLSRPIMHSIRLFSRSILTLTEADHPLRFLSLSCRHRI